MSITQLSNMSHVFLGLGIFLIIVDLILFYVLDINKAWHITTGRQMKNKPAKQKEPKGQKRVTQKIATQKLQSESAMSKINVIKTDFSAMNQTTLINQNHDSATMPLQLDGYHDVNQATSLLNNNIQNDATTPTTVLQPNSSASQYETAFGQTTELPKRGETPPYVLQSPETTDLGVFRVKYDVTFIHTGVKI